jgi:phosphate transport system permease protein
MAAGAPEMLLRRAGFEWKEESARVLLFLCALVSIATTFGIIAVLAFESFAFFQQIPLIDFLFGTRWTPLLEPRSYGVLPLVCGTTLIVVGSGLIAIPIGLLTGIYLSEYANSRVRRTLKPILEILAGIPTVVYGYFALTFVTPILMAIFPQTQIFNAASGAIVVGIMILPMVASLCEDALRTVPQSMRQAGFALGATRFEVSTQIVLPGALSGVLASFVLALSRAIGETMAVTLASGATPKLTLNPLESIQTMTAYIVQISLGDTPAGTIEYKTLFAVGALLFLITLGMNVLGQWILHRYHEIYE